MNIVPVKNLLIFGPLFLVLAVKSQSVNEEFCKGKPSDIVFILDSSSSIWGEHFQKQLDFVTYMIDRLQIGPNADQIRIGIVTFSDFARIHLNLNNFLNKAVLKTEINEIPQTLGNTSIWHALRVMRTQMFRPSRGARPNVRHVAILLTDGTSQDEFATQQEAKACRQSKIEMFVIGIGHHISKSELRGISSKPYSKYLILTPSYKSLDLIRNDVINKACEIDKGAEDIKDVLCKDQPLDIVFVLDSSSSIAWREHFQKQLDFFNYMVDRLDIGNGSKQVRIGVQIFSDFARIYIRFNDFKDKTELKWKINQIPQSIHDSNIADALRLLRTNMFAAHNRARPYARRVAILLTDRTSTDEAATQQEARACRQANIEIFVIGTGSCIKEAELRGISSQPHSKYLFLTPNYSGLDMIRNDVINKICENACNSYQKTEVMFMVNNNHFGTEKTRLILTVFHKILKNSEKFRNFHFGIIFDDCLHHQDLSMGSFTERSQMSYKFNRHQSNSFVALIKKLQYKMFSHRGSHVRRVGLMVLDRSIELNRPDVAAEIQRLRSEHIEIYAVLIGDVDQKFLRDLHVPQHQIIRSKSYNDMIFDVPSRFNKMMCRV